MIIADNTVLRDELEHRDRVCQLSQLSKPAYKYWSKEYGVNGGSVLLQVPGFEITRCLLQDPMHLLFEGVLKYAFQRMLRVMIHAHPGLSNKLNNRLNNFEYICHELTDRPHIFDFKQLQVGTNLAESAAEMKTLICILPFLLDDIVSEDDDHRINFMGVPLLVPHPIVPH
jgi:hypothetical protein